VVDITYNVYLDLTGNGDFSDDDENISGYVIEALVKRGAANPWDTIARDTQIEVELDNSTQLFSPEAGGALSGLKPSARLAVDMTYDSVTERLGIGRVARDGIRVDPGSYGKRRAGLSTYGLLLLLQEEMNVELALQTNVTTDQVIALLIDASGIYPFAFTGWLLGITGYSELGVSTVLSDGPAGFLDLDTGSNTLAYVGDQWGQQVSLYTMLKQLMEAERGLLYERRDGWLAMRSRHYFIEDVATAVDAAITDAHLIASKKQEYGYGESVVNDVTVTGYPRQVGTARTVVARYPIASGTGHIIPSGSTSYLTLDYKDSGGASIGAYDVVFDLTTDYTTGFWNSVTQQIETGSPSLVVSVQEAAGKVTLVIANEDSSHAIIMPGSTDSTAITVRGYAIQTFDGLTVNEQNTDSISEILRQSMRLDLKLLSDADAVQSTALFELGNRGTIQGHFTHITLSPFKSEQCAEWVRDLTIGDRISVTETQTGHTGEYFIVGEEHRVLNGATEHYATYTLRPASTGWWVLGVSELGVSTTLSY
jgi:hypothetical protein